jgi:hypothetical protein
VTVVIILLVIAAAGWLRHVDKKADWSTTLTAVGTVGAAAAALFIATRDRADRRRERFDSDRAQARLLHVAAGGPGDWHYPTDDGEITKSFFTIGVENMSLATMLDVTLESAVYEHGGLRIPLLLHEEFSATTHPVLMSFTQVERPSSANFHVRTDDQRYQWLYEFKERTPGGIRDYRSDPANIVAMVQFTDAHNNRWRRSNKGAVELIGKPGRGSGGQ